MKTLHKEEHFQETDIHEGGERGPLFSRVLIRTHYLCVCVCVCVCVPLRHDENTLL